MSIAVYLGSHERKQLLEGLSDCCVVLSGIWGTIDEIAVDMIWFCDSVDELIERLKKSF